MFIILFLSVLVHYVPIALALDGDASTSYRDPRPELHKWVQFELDSEKAALPLSEVIISLNLPK